jgi:YidC/Oxa1 family membrane protein insertase
VRQLYVQLVRDGAKPGSKTPFYSTFTGPAVYTDAKKYQKVEFKDIEKGKAEFVKQASDGYVAMVQHYFASAWLLRRHAARQLRPQGRPDNLYAVGMITPLAEWPRRHQTVDTRLFVGPQVETMLESVTPGLELVKDYGWSSLAKPLYWLLDQIHKVLGNWGWSIVALVLLLKIAFYWLAKAYVSMAKMKAINPKIRKCASA